MFIDEYRTSTDPNQSKEGAHDSKDLLSWADFSRVRAQNGNVEVEEGQYDIIDVIRACCRCRCHCH